MTGSAFFPVIEIRLEGMKHTLRVAMAEHLLGMDKMINEAIEKACTPDAISRIVRQSAEEEVKRAIQDEISKFYRYGLGREAVASAVLETLKERTGQR